MNIMIYWMVIEWVHCNRSFAPLIHLLIFKVNRMVWPRHTVSNQLHSSICLSSPACLRQNKCDNRDHLQKQNNYHNENCTLLFVHILDDRNFCRVLTWFLSFDLFIFPFWPFVVVRSFECIWNAEKVKRNGMKSNELLKSPKKSL